MFKTYPCKSCSSGGISDNRSLTWKNLVDTRDDIHRRLTAIHADNWRIGPCGVRCTSYNSNNIWRTSPRRYNICEHILNPLVVIKHITRLVVNKLFVRYVRRTASYTHYCIKAKKYVHSDFQQGDLKSLSEKYSPRAHFFPRNTK